MNVASTLLLVWTGPYVGSCLPPHSVNSHLRIFSQLRVLSARLCQNDNRSVGKHKSSCSCLPNAGRFSPRWRLHNGRGLVSFKLRQVGDLQNYYSAHADRLLYHFPKTECFPRWRLFKKLRRLNQTKQPLQWSGLLYFKKTFNCGELLQRFNVSASVSYVRVQ